MRFTLALVCTLPLMAVFHWLYFYLKNKHARALRITVKCCATLMCVLMAALGHAAQGVSPLTSLLFWGTVFCMIGDGLLAIHFLSGMGAFGLGHLFLITWIFRLSGSFSPLSLPVWIIGYAAVLWAFRGYLRRLGKPLPAFLLYAAVLMGMASVAVLLPVRIGACALCVAVGGVLFAASDMFVAKGIFDKLSPAWDRFALGIYYLSVYCFALGAWLL